MLPEKFVERMRDMLGEECDSFLASYDHEKYQALRVNPLKGTREEFLEKAPFSLTPVPWEEDGFYYSGEDQPGKHPFHEAGAYYIQEPSAMAPVGLLGARPGEHILDLCAAPGGKTTQIAGKMKGRGLLVSNEIHPARAKILSENVERLGITNCLVTNETPQHLAQVFPDYFDRILVDAPCSGEGMFRKNEEACGEWSQENVRLCAQRQDEIMDCAARMLRAGGRLVYSTCTFAPQENEGSIARFLVRHPEFFVAEIPAAEEFSPGNPAWAEEEMGEMPDPAGSVSHTFRLWPHKLKGEGHFAAVLEKRGEWEEGFHILSAGGLVRGLSRKDCADWLTFEEETLLGRREGSFLAFGDQLYLCPEDMPGLKGLKVLRPGLHLGTRKKNRFEPSHALALALKPQEVKHSLMLSAEDVRVRDYLNGLTFPAEGEKGWYLICADGYSLGWGKLAGGVMKNHYPRGLRK